MKKAGGDRVLGTSSPHPLALCLSKASGVRSAYRSAALVENHKRCDEFPEDAEVRCLPLLYPISPSAEPGAPSAT